MYDIKSVADCQHAIDRLWGFVENVAALRDSAAYLAEQESRCHALEARNAEYAASIKEQELKLAELQDKIYGAAEQERETRKLLQIVAAEVEAEAQKARQQAEAARKAVLAEAEMEIKNLQAIRASESARLKRDYDEAASNMEKAKKALLDEIQDLQARKNAVLAELTRLRERILA